MDAFVPPAPYLVCKPVESPYVSGILVQPALIDAHFRKAWMPNFRRRVARTHGRSFLCEAAMAGHGMRLQRSLSWFVGLAQVLRQIESEGRWPQGLLDAFFSMIPKAEGDSTPLGQRPLCVLPVVYRLWASVHLSTFRTGSILGCLSLCSVLYKGSLLLTSIDVEEVLSNFPYLLC